MIQSGRRLTSIGNDDVELTSLLLNELGSCLIIFLISRVQLDSVNIGVFGGEVFQGLSGRVTGTCEDDAVGAFGDGGGETKTDTTVSTGDWNV